MVHFARDQMISLLSACITTQPCTCWKSWLRVTFSTSLSLDRYQIVSSSILRLLNNFERPVKVSSLRTTWEKSLPVMHLQIMTHFRHQYPPSSYRTLEQRDPGNEVDSPAAQGHFIWKSMLSEDATFHLGGVVIHGGLKEIYETLRGE